MACEKYSQRIAQATLGETAPRGDAELLLHLSACPSCSEVFDAALALRAAMDRGLEALVAGAPSPQFAARLRSRMARIPARRPIFAAWIPAAAGGLALAAVLALWILRTAPARNDRPPAIAGLPIPPSAVAAPRPLPPVSQSGRRRSPPSIPARLAEPEVLVPPGQLDLLREFAEDVYSGRVNGVEIIDRQREMKDPLEIRPLETHALEIQAIEIPAMKSAADDSPESAGDHGGL